MRSKANLPILIVYIAVTMTILGGIVSQLGVVYPWQHPFTLTANFSDSAAILTNNEVDMNGVTIGHVGTVNVRNGSAYVQLIIDDGSALPIYSDATAEVRKKNLLGETYIDVQRGGTACTNCALASGANIAMDHTVPITEIDQVLAIFDPTTVQRVQLLLDAAGQGTTNNGQNMNSGASYANQLITSLNGPAVELSVRHQQLNDIVLELQKLYDKLAIQRGQVEQEFTTWNAVMAQLANQDGSIATTLQQADTLLGSLDTLLSGQDSNLIATLNQLPGALQNTEAFLTQTNTILGGVLPYRGSIHDVFPNLGSSFADTDLNGQHFWSVYAVNCNSGCGSAQSSAPPSAPPSASWALDMVGGS